MKKLLLLSLFTIAGVYHAIKPIAAMAMQNQSEDSIAFLIFKVAALKALDLPKEEALTKLNTLFKEADIKTFDTKAKKFIRAKIEEKLPDLKLSDLQRYETLYPIVARERIVRQTAQAASTVLIKNNSYSINEPNSKNDYQAIAELIKYDFDELKQKEVQYLVEKMQSRSLSVKVMRNPHGAVIGLVAYTPGVWKTHIDILCIHKDYRRQGLGKEFLNAVIEQEKSLGCKKIALYSRFQTAHFYHKVGFKFEGEQHIKGGTCLVYSKNIAE